MQRLKSFQKNSCLLQVLENTLFFSTSILEHHPQIFFHRFVTVLLVLLPWYFVEGESQIAPVEQIDYFRKQNLGW